MDVMYLTLNSRCDQVHFGIPCEASPLLGHSKPVLVLPVALGVLLHGGAGIGHKRLAHGLAHPKAQELVRPGPLPLPKHRWACGHRK